MVERFGEVFFYSKSGVSRLAGITSLFLLACSLSGCLASLTPQPEPARYDLFAVSEADSATKPALAADIPALRLTEIQAPSWLQTSAMQYRLSYLEPSQRASYAHSRWVAAPAELLEQVLRRTGLIKRNRYEPDGCQLHLELQEFIQDFQAEDASQVIIRLRASLQTARGDLLAREDFQQQQVAGADAHQGVAAFQSASRDLSRNMAAWLQGLQNQKPDLESACQGV